MPDATFVDRVRTMVSANRWATVLSVAAALVAGIGGALIGLSPVFIVPLLVIVVIPAFVISMRRNRTPEGHDRLGSALTIFSLVTVVAFGLIQLVPYGRDHANPTVTGEPAWSSPRTRELMVNSCFGCHSNEVDWPWYSNIAPVSWAVLDHVDEGRGAVNYSEFDTDQGDADETIEVILDGEMPPGYYTLFGLHPEANLTEAEIDELVAGLRATPGMSEDN
jgi:hypothetical protein